MALMQESARKQMQDIQCSVYPQECRKPESYKIVSHVRYLHVTFLTFGHLRELLQALALGVVLTLQALKVSANLRQLQLQLGVTTVQKNV